ncbi:MAG: D-amino-acid oxidase [Rhodospirillales bacterium 70-18]|nr:MAG: D-amino-acid oxidase [Rhodospirillales bacterium 70-18]
MLPPLETLPSDDRLPERAEIVVIGGGIVGASAAYYLAKKGHRVALLEKGLVGAEQSSRNWGWCRQQNRDARELPLAQRSLALWDGLRAETGMDLGFRRSGLVYVTTDPADLAQWEKWGEFARQRQVDTRMLSAAEARALAAGSTGQWIGGVHSPTDGIADPSRAAPALAAAARRLGASIHQHCAARGLETTGGAVSGVVTERGTIRTATVLCAGGAWASMFCRWHGIDFPQAGVRSTVFRTAPLPDVVKGGFYCSDFSLARRLDGGYTVSMPAAGRLDVTPQGLRYARAFWPAFRSRRKALHVRLGGSFLRGPEALARWRLDQVSPFERMRVLDPAPNLSAIEATLARVRACYPELAGIAVAQSWCGWIDTTPDMVPVISPLDRLPGLHLAAGFSGHGFGIGPAAGQLAADLIVGDPPAVDPYPFRHARLVDGSPITPPGAI